MLETKKVSSPKGETKMYYRQKFDTFIRNYEGAGYITNTGNFSDRVVNGSGTVFLTALSRKPQTLEELVQKACKAFIDVRPQDIIEDARTFYDELFEERRLFNKRQHYRRT
ncbi:hypothetical protein E4N90_12900 [Treponema denticola]|uniref:PqqD family peptide modification chaperone n=1 Tax=Treponema denticola TaxID=158 RepID=UPI0020A23B91|nr:PqqD family peptide modification chaperone [Treponema denticola]UTD08797.1 hypothetical protein E4N90_12900 [Treponema denticola]